VTALLPLLLACAAAPTPTTVDSGDPLLEVGRIEGVLTRSVPVAGNGIGHVFIGVYLPGADDEPPALLQAWAQGDVDVRADDFALPFAFENLFPHSAPLRVAAIFDEAEDLVEDTPDCMACDGDLATVALYEQPLHSLRIESGQTHVMELELAVVATRDWPAGSGAPGGELEGATGDGVLEGTVSRTASGGGDNVGDVWMMLFEDDPLAGGAPITLDSLPGVDLSDPDTTVGYRLEGLPTRAEGYFLVAFLDDNSSGSMPDADDIIALDGASVPRVVLVDGDETRFDVVLSANPI
jgi:hypothetical protein